MTMAEPKEETAQAVKGGELLVCGATDYWAIGRTKDVRAEMYPNLQSPHRFKTMMVRWGGPAPIATLAGAPAPVELARGGGAGCGFPGARHPTPRPASLSFHGHAVDLGFPPRFISPGQAHCVHCRRRCGVPLAGGG